MFYANKIKRKNISYKKVNYASFANGINTDYDENILPLRYAKSTYNYCYLNGALKTGLGVKEIELKSDTNKVKDLYIAEGVKPLAMYVYKNNSKIDNTYMDMLIVYASDKNLYASSLYSSSSSFILLGQTFEKCPLVANYRINGEDSIIFMSSSEGMYVWNGIDPIKKIENAPDITSMAIHFERMFVTVKDDSCSIYFSDDLDPTNWSQSLTEGGFISLIDDRGISKKIISFNDSLYIFREYGIDRLIAYSDQTNFQVNSLFTSSTKIFTDTVKVCGDRIMFLAEDGIYYFTGLSTTKYNLNINNMFEKSLSNNSIGAYHNGKYFLACRLKFDDESEFDNEENFVNNVLIELDPRTGEMNILRGYNILNLMSFNTRFQSKLLILIEENLEKKLGEITETGEVFGVATKKVWKSPNTNLNEPLNEKLIKSLSLKTDTNIIININYDGLKKSYHIDGGRGIKTIYPNIKCMEFAIDFICDKSECNISNPEMIVGVL